MIGIWNSEKHAILLTAFFILFSGITFDQWLLSIAIPLFIYIVWIYYRLYRLEKWLARGAKSSEVFDDNGFIDLIIRHIFIQRKSFNKRKKKTKELIRRLNTNISALPDATVLLNQHFEIEWANDPASYLLGITRQDRGQRIDNLIRHPKFKNYLNDPDRSRYLEIESHLAKNVTLQIKIVKFGKNQRLLIAQNISDQKQLQAALKNFVANASHELQTPLTSIMGHLELMEMSNSLPDTAKNSVQVAQQQAHRMKSMITDLLILSRLESYRLRMDEGKNIDISGMMQNVMTHFDLEHLNDRLDIDVEDELCILGVEFEVIGICTNLIENALKHNPDGTKVSISWYKNDKRECVFEVADKGQGIEKEHLPFLTDRYYRVQPTDQPPINGTGLGLSIVQQAIQKHGGQLEIESELKKGSIFRVIFPSYRTVKF